LLRPLPLARIAYAAIDAATYRPLQQTRDPVDLLEKLRLCRKLRPSLQRLVNNNCKDAGVRQPNIMWLLEEVPVMLTHDLFYVFLLSAVTDGAAQTPVRHHGAGMSLFHSPGGASVRLPSQVARDTSRPQARKSLSQRRDGDQDRRLRSRHAPRL